MTQPRKKSRGRVRYGLAGAVLGSGLTAGIMHRRRLPTAVPKVRRFSAASAVRGGLRMAKKTKFGRSTMMKILAQPRLHKFIIDAI